MKHISILLTVTILLCMISGCSTQGEPLNNDESAYAETGYLNGQVQFEAVCYNGMIWRLDYYTTESQHLEALPDGYVYVGCIISENPYELPQDELCSAHINVGTEVYASIESPDAIYLAHYWEDGTFGRFVPIEQ